jgi:hypothetical protein
MASVGDILKRLGVLDAERIELLTQLRTMGFRSRGLVGEYGELLAASLYDVSLPVTAPPGYDLEVPGLGRVQVKTLRSTATSRRTSMGPMKDPYDVLLAIRLDAEYRPTAAWQIPRTTIELIYPHGTRTSLTARLLSGPDVVAIPSERLLEAARHVGAGEAADREAGERPSATSGLTRGRWFDAP